MGQRGVDSKASLAAPASSGLTAFLAAVSVGAGVQACAPHEGSPLEPPHSRGQEGVINGEDDRRELYEVESEDARAALAASVGALMWSHRIDYARPSALNAVSLEEAFDVCPDEPFATQPAAAWCSATLIDDDLVLTAGHCLGASPADAARSCAELLVVFDYHQREEGKLALSTGDGIYACRAVVRHEHRTSTESFRDFAILQLDRPVSSVRKPAVLAPGPPRVGEALIAATHASGLPLKVDSGGSIVDVPSGADHFVASTDSFAGGSGGPLFNASLELVGHQVRGLPDWVSDGECQRTAHADAPEEQHQLLSRSIEALCDAWPSERLCGRRAVCGDGACNAGETPRDCSEDCRSPSCGDRLCELAERATCDSDCAAYAGVPPDWLEEPASFPGHSADPGSAGAPAREVEGGRRAAASHAGCSSRGTTHPAPAAACAFLLGLAILWKRACLRVQR